jgi:hypothetical protein
MYPDRTKPLTTLSIHYLYFRVEIFSDLHGPPYIVIREP